MRITARSLTRASAASWLGFALLAVALGSSAHAADAPGVSLLRPDSLAGWDYGSQPPAHWIISGGQLTGNSLSTPLLSGWTLGDFELRFQWSAGPGAAWNLGLPDVPSGAGLTITIKEGEGCGAVRDGEKSLAGGARVEAATAGAKHTANIRRSGGTLSIIVDGRVVSETTLDRNRRFGLALSVPGGEATLAQLRLEEPRGNPLFNGQDMVGWHVNNDKGTWAVENGALTPTSHRGLHYLRTDKEYANFTWSFEYRISKGGNSGVAIRTATGGWPSGDGMEMQILDQPGEVKDSTMAIYGNLPPLDRADRSEQWNRVVIKTDGRMVSAWVNGELVQQVNTALLPEVRHRHLKGWLGLQDHGGKPLFKEIYVLEAPDGLGLDAWYATPRESGPAIVLDRLMNSQRLSQADGITSGVATATVPKGGQHVLAELTGPGALVRCWRSYAAGRLAFYFDGEDQPRIECSAEHLCDNVPGIAHEEQPTLMCLPYAKSLKIVVSDPLAATYRLDYVTFPSELPVESYTHRRPGIPRGMLEAITYRHDGLRGGKLREAEIYERIDTQPRTIEPGTTVQMASLDGAGIVNWLKLRADKSALENNDLWIEVTIDGESVPAIVAPARFFFPTYGPGEAPRDFSTLVTAAREGFANLLAMPYGQGLTVSLRNRGAKPVEKVAVSMSVDRATDANRADYAGRMRLRGVFQPAGSLNQNLAQQAGAGRWVGLVYQKPEEAATGIATLEVDGQPREGWTMDDLDPLWGHAGEGGRTFFRALSGRRQGLAWSYLLLAPVDFHQSLVIKPHDGDKLGDRLALFYLKN